MPSESLFRRGGSSIVKPLSRPNDNDGGPSLEEIGERGNGKRRITLKERLKQ